MMHRLPFCTTWASARHSWLCGNVCACVYCRLDTLAWSSLICSRFTVFCLSAERKTSLGKDWHSGCLRCEKCNKTLTPGGHSEHEGKPYCNNPCYSALFGPGGFGRGGAESYKY